MLARLREKKLKVGGGFCPFILDICVSNGAWKLSQNSAKPIQFVSLVNGGDYCRMNTDYTQKVPRHAFWFEHDFKREHFIRRDMTIIIASNVAINGTYKLSQTGLHCF